MTTENTEDTENTERKILKNSQLQLALQLATRRQLPVHNLIIVLCVLRVLRGYLIQQVFAEEHHDHLLVQIAVFLLAETVTLVQCIHIPDLVTVGANGSNDLL